jgi:hypothetical protein
VAYEVQEHYSGARFTVDISNQLAPVSADALASLGRTAGVRGVTLRAASSTAHAVVQVGLSPGTYRFQADPLPAEGR